MLSFSNNRIQFSWREMLAIAGLIWLLRPLPEIWDQQWRLLKYDLPILSRLDQRIPTARRGELKYMYPFIEYVNAQIPRNESTLFAGDMKYAIRVHYYTFPRDLTWLCWDHEYEEVAPQVLDGTVDWLIVNGLDDRFLSACKEQLEQVYGAPDDYQRIFRVRHD
jgi:hypothetical protein